MATQRERVEKLLKRRPVTGISVRDFPRGFRLASVIERLRGKGWVINTHQATRQDIAHYHLVRAPK